MILCPSCQHKELTGAMFCSECGAPLVGTYNLITQSIHTDQMGSSIHDIPTNHLPPINVTTNTQVSLHLLEKGQILPLADLTEFTLGRISEGQPIMPDVDLSMYQAYASGVSRLHAVLKREGHRVAIMDLGSANGTYVNGKRMTANSELTLSHGDVISLGKLKIQILFKNPA